METNALPHYDVSDNPTKCCPRFNPEGWDDVELHFKDKLFLKATTRSLFHIPVNMGKIFDRTMTDIAASHAQKEDDCIVLSRDPSPWKGEHYFSASKMVPGHSMIHLSGDFVTKVFEGPYRDMVKWDKEMKAFVEAKGLGLKDMYYFYTTCPKCTKVYGKNYVVGVAEVVPEAVAA